MRKLISTIFTITLVSVMVSACSEAQTPEVHTSSEEVSEHVATEEMPDHHDHESHKKYACPMQCEGEKTYTDKGDCPACNMKLEEARK